MGASLSNQVRQNNEVDLSAVSMPKQALNQLRIDRIESLFDRAKGVNSIAVDFGSGTSSDQLHIKRDGKGGYTFQQIQFDMNQESCTIFECHVNNKGLVTSASISNKTTSSEPAVTTNIPNVLADKTVDVLIKKFQNKN